MDEYIDSTKKSWVVFNTPSVQGCHGWKLGEYLAMGKCILSMPHNNRFPSDFINRVHYYGMESEEEILPTLRLLHDSPDVVSQLSMNSHKYYDDYLRPDVMIERIMRKVQ